MRLNWRKLRVHLQTTILAYVLLLASLSLTAIVWYYAQRAADIDRETKFRSDVQAGMQAMDRRVNAYLDVFNGLRSLFALKDTVTLQDFYGFLDHYNVNEHCPGVYLIGFSPRVTPATKSAHESQMRRMGYSTYAITPPGDRPDYFPANFLYPYDVENSALSERNMVGLDSVADPDRREAMDKARDTGLPVATRPIRFAYDPAHHPSFLIYSPIYETGAYLNSVADRRARLKGYVYAGFRVSDFFGNILDKTLARSLGFSVSAAHGGPVLFDSGSPGDRTAKHGAGISQTLRMAGQELTIRFFSLPGAGTVAGADMPALLLGGGLVVSLLVFGMSLQLLRAAAARKSAEAARRQAAEAERNSAALSKSEARFRSIFEHATVGIAQMSLAGEFLQVNNLLCEMFGYARDEFLQLTFRDVTHEADLKKVAVLLRRLVAGEVETVALEKRYIRKNGTVGWAYLSVSMPAHEPAEPAEHLLAVVRDTTDRKLIEDGLRASEEKFRATIEHAPVGVAQVSLDGAWLHVNRKFCDITGYAPEELYRLSAQDITHPDDLDLGQQHFTQLLSGQLPTFSIEKRYLRKDGATVWTSVTAALTHNADGQPEYVLKVVEDITERKENQERLAYLAQFDPLTGLPNLHLFRDRLFHAMVRAIRQGTQVALLFFDLDKFKEINDLLGHSTGDQVLKMVAERIKDALRDSDTVARFGGDEFTVIIEDVNDPADVADVAQKVIGAFEAPFMLDTQEFFLTTSIGIALYPNDAHDIDAMLKKADMAMYYAKEQGRNTYRFFTSSLDAEAAERLHMKNQLRHALERNELQLYYQPQVKFGTRELIGAEALLRWFHPELGMISPAKFVPLLEETGLIVPVGEWILRTACEQNKAWQDAGLPPIRVAVNLSARQMRTPFLADDIIRVIERTGVAPEFIEIEITEGMLIENMHLGRNTLNRLREYGVQVALDDFGTGYSSLSYLTTLPLDVLKMDGSFVRNLSASSPDAANSLAIAQAIITLAHSLNLEVVAEAVETEEQWAQLNALSCDIMQGYLYSRPLPAAEMTALMRAASGVPSKI